MEWLTILRNFKIVCSAKGKMRAPKIIKLLKEDDLNGGTSKAS
jgi:hypothetical protein